MTHEEIFQRSFKDLIHSKNSSMLEIARNYSNLFVNKCLDDGVNPALVNAWSKVINIAYEGNKKRLT